VSREPQFKEFENCMDSIRQINQKKNQELGILARLHTIEAEYMIEKLPKIG